jgi:hypothetical protein
MAAISGFHKSELVDFAVSIAKRSMYFSGDSACENLNSW